ncbi:hypothetical protein BC938DRAFT_472111 [Jimgerdemannia flammicorona]|uniref:Uncharacterized protein n=1 Tax=Jimgerdemannia flammicorona TaxID=994334 RepID=A0A433QU64_9FUNG|nr:hypothetical protein BC938DRAFT_472111 [Jimgerdemannia flammicorona]
MSSLLNNRQQEASRGTTDKRSQSATKTDSQKGGHGKPSRSKSEQPDVGASISGSPSQDRQSRMQNFFALVNVFVFSEKRSTAKIPVFLAIVDVFDFHYLGKEPRTATGISTTIPPDPKYGNITKHQGQPGHQNKGPSNPSHSTESRVDVDQEILDALEAQNSLPRGKTKEFFKRISDWAKIYKENSRLKGLFYDVSDVLQQQRENFKETVANWEREKAEWQKQLAEMEAEHVKTRENIKDEGAHKAAIEDVRHDCETRLVELEMEHQRSIQEIERLKNVIQLQFEPEHHHRLREEIKIEFQQELSKAEQQIAHLTYEKDRHREQKEDYLNRIEKMNIERSEIYSKIMDLEKKLVLEMSFRPQENQAATGIFAMDGANPMTLNQTWPKVYMTMRKAVENMFKQGALRTDVIHARYDELLRHATIPTDRTGKPGKSVQKRLVEHAISVKLAAIWDVILLDEGGRVERSAGEAIFPEIEKAFKELGSLQDGQVSEMSVLVGRMKAELARQLLGRLPVPTDVEVEKKFKEQPDFNPFVGLGSRYGEQMRKFWRQMAETVIQTLAEFTGESTLEQWMLSVYFLVYTCIHVRLQMEAIGSGGMMVFFAGSTIDCLAILKEEQRGKSGSSVVLESELHDAVESINRSKRGEECEEDKMVFLTVFPGVANVKMNDGRITIDEQIQKQCLVLSC